MIVEVSIDSKNAWMLRFVLPSLSFSGRGDQVFCPIGKTYLGSELTVVQSRSGYDLTGSRGLANFLLEIGLFTTKKAEGLTARKLGDVDLFRAASRLIVQGRIPSDSEVEDTFIHDAARLRGPDQVMFMMQVGPRRILKSHLTSIEKFFTVSVKQSLEPKKVAYYQRLFANFKLEKFRTYELVGDDELDCLTLLSFF